RTRPTRRERARASLVGQKVAPREQRGEGGLSLHRLASALQPIDETERAQYVEASEARALDRAQRGSSGRDHVLEDHDRGALGELRALDPLVGAVALRLLAHDECRARLPGVEARDTGGGGERVGTERETADRYGPRRDFTD